MHGGDYGTESRREGIHCAGGNAGRSRENDHMDADERGDDGGRRARAAFMDGDEEFWNR